MPPRFDDDKCALALSVADLLEQDLSRNVGFANRGGHERMWLGQAIHSRYQEGALREDASYRRERSLVLELVHRRWQVRLQGRIDGVRRDGEGSLVVEEIKSVRPSGRLSPSVRELYERQAAIYAWMLSGIEKEPVRAELVLIEIGSEVAERFPLEVDLKGVEAGVKRRLNALLRLHEAARAAASRRREAARRLVFPYPQRRPGQERIEAEVERAVEAREHLLVEAATGLGKTVATLYPVLRFALAEDKRVLVLTAKTLQQEMATAVLELLNPDGDFRSLRLRAKARMCANDEVLCHEEYCPYARDYSTKLHDSGVVEHLVDAYPTLRPDEIFAAAKGAEVCPFEVSLELAGQVQVTVCDYNYVFDPYVALREFSAESDLSDVILVVDEIHNLVDRGRGYYSPELSAARATEVARSIAGSADAARRLQQLHSILLRLAEMIETTASEGLQLESAENRAAEAVLPEDELWRLRPELDAAFVDYLEYRRETKSFRSNDPFVSLYFDFVRFLNALELSDDAFSQCVAREAGASLIKILCKDASRFLGQVINRTHSTVGLSATLSPPEFYVDLLGFDASRTSRVSVASPFPEENRRVVIDRSVATTWRERPANYQPIADRLARFAASVPGNTLVLFPSYEFLSEVARRLPPLNKRVLIQRQVDGQAEREAILETLRSALLGNNLLLAVAGGVFAEGVDYPGEMLRAVAVVGPCLPALTLEQKLLEAYFQERYERGFEYAFIVPGMTRVVQAAGRLIRSHDDTGVIALLDRRFLSAPYRGHLPADWLPTGGAEALTGDPAAVAERFFAELQDGP